MDGDRVMQLRVPTTRPPLKSSSPSETVVQDMIKELKAAKTSAELKKNCQMLSQHVSHEMKCGKNRISDQINFLRKERELALKQQTQREAELKRLKRQLEVIQTEYKLVDKARVKTLQSQLQAAITDRDVWKDKAERLDEMCETLQLVTTLQRSMSKESEIQKEYGSKLINLQSSLEEQKEKEKLLNLKLEQTIQECNTAIEERNLLVHELLQERGRSDRLEELVEVLKKRLILSDTSLYTVNNT